MYEYSCEGGKQSSRSHKYFSICRSSSFFSSSRRVKDYVQPVWLYGLVLLSPLAFPSFIRFVADSTHERVTPRLLKGNKKVNHRSVPRSMEQGTVELDGGTRLPICEEKEHWWQCGSKAKRGGRKNRHKKGKHSPTPSHFSLPASAVDGPTLNVVLS